MHPKSFEEHFFPNYTFLYFSLLKVWLSLDKYSQTAIFQRLINWYMPTDLLHNPRE